MKYEYPLLMNAVVVRTNDPNQVGIIEANHCNWITEVWDCGRLGDDGQRTFVVEGGYW